jgi:hypothetical protein
MSLRVNVGMGATDPQQKMGKFMFALTTYGTAMQIPGADPEAIRREVFGLAGYKDGSRFFVKQDDPQTMQLQQQMQQLMQQFQQLAQEHESLKLDKSAQMLSAQTGAAKAEADAHKAAYEVQAKSAMTDADIDLKEAQTLKTLAEAGAAAEPELETAGTSKR